MSITSERLTQVMKGKGVSLRDLAAQTGYSKSALSYYINGTRSMTCEKGKKIADALGVRAAWLAGWEDDPTEERRSASQQGNFIRSFLRLTEENQRRILDLMQALLDGQERQSEHNGKEVVNGKRVPVSERLRYIMESRNLRQADIFRLIEPYCMEANVHIPRNALSQYLAGKVTPREDKIEILSKALDVSEAWLMGFDVPMERDAPARENGMEERR